MSRRKQSRPMKRPLEDEEQEQLDEKTGSGTKNIRLDQPSTSSELGNLWMIRIYIKRREMFGFSLQVANGG